VQSLKRSPLYGSHVAIGARFINFAGWDAPVQYRSILEEHRTVRSQAGVFDVSHLGRLRVMGDNATDLLQRVCTPDIAALPVGRAHYSLMCHEEGGIVDDAMVYRLDEQSYLVVCNAVNTAKDIDWLNRWVAPGWRVLISDDTMTTAMIACQGPRAAQTMQGIVVGASVLRLRPFDWIRGNIIARPTLISRTGYTGEDGFEIIVQDTDSLPLWQVFLFEGATPCGLGARDTLRLEAGLVLYGQDIDATTNPLEAGLGWVIAWNKEFVGKEALLRVKEGGVKRKLVGFEMVGPGIARSGYPIVKEGQEVGKVTSGSYAPWLKKNIGMGYVPTELSTPGTELDISVRGSITPARVARRPLYKRPAAVEAGKGGSDLIDNR